MENQADVVVQLVIGVSAGISRSAVQFACKLQIGPRVAIRPCRLRLGEIVLTFHWKAIKNESFQLLTGRFVPPQVQMRVASSGVRFCFEWLY